MDMLNITEQQAKGILDFLTKRIVSKCTMFGHAPSRCKLFAKNEVLIEYIWGNENTQSSSYFLLARSCKDRYRKYTIFQDGLHDASSLQLLDILLKTSSKGYDIISLSDVFLPAYTTLEQILIEKDLEESMIA